MDDDIIKKIANLINEDDPLSLFHSDDEFGPVPETESQLLSQVFSNYDFKQPAEAAIAKLRAIVQQYGLSDELANSTANEIMANYKQYQKQGGYPLVPEGPSQFY